MVAGPMRLAAVHFTNPRDVIERRFKLDFYLSPFYSIRGKIALESVYRLLHGEYTPAVWFATNRGVRHEPTTL